MRIKQLQKNLQYDLNTGIFYDQKSKKVVGKTDPDGYIQIWIDGNNYRADKLAWFYVHSSWPKHDIIHRDGVKCNNWINNLKKESNKKKRKDNISGVPGVSWVKRDRRWRSDITFNNKQTNLGSYDKFDNAVLARLKGEQKFGRDKNSPAQQYINKMFL